MRQGVPTAEEVQHAMMEVTGKVTRPCLVLESSLLGAMTHVLSIQPHILPGLEEILLACRDPGAG